MNCKDPVIKEIARNKDFRIGLSYAINRQEIIDVVFLGQGTPAQTSPRPDSKYYHERLAKQYIEFDLKKSAEYLDKAYPKKDAQGFRLGPDGKRISIIFEIDSGRTTYIDALELIKKSWAKVGVEINVKTMDRALWEQRVRGTDFEYHASCHIFGGGSGDAVILDPRYWFPQNNTNSFWAKAWAIWYNDPKNALAEEPPAEVKKQMELYTEIRATSDDTKQQALLKQILDIQADQFPTIGTAFDGNFYGISTDKLKNTPKSCPSSYDYPTPSAAQSLHLVFRLEHAKIFRFFWSRSLEKNPLILTPPHPAPDRGRVPPRQVRHLSLPEVCYDEPLITKISVWCSLFPQVEPAP